MQGCKIKPWKLFGKMPDSFHFSEHVIQLKLPFFPPIIAWPQIAFMMIYFFWDRYQSCYASIYKINIAWYIPYSWASFKNKVLQRIMVWMVVYYHYWPVHAWLVEKYFINLSVELSFYQQQNTAFLVLLIDPYIFNCNTSSWSALVHPFVPIVWKS